MTAAGSPRIVSLPEVRGGRPCISGRRIAVADIAFLADAGEGVDAILEAYPALTLADVEAALEDRQEHRAEIDSELAEDEGWEEEHQRLRDAYLAARRAGEAAT